MTYFFLFALLLFFYSAVFDDYDIFCPMLINLFEFRSDQFEWLIH